MKVEAIHKINDAHDMVSVTAQDLMFIAEFFQAVSENIEDASRGQIDPAEIFEYGDRLRFLINLLRERQKKIEAVSELLDHASLALKNGGEVPLPLAAD